MLDSLKSAFYTTVTESLFSRGSWGAKFRDGVQPEHVEYSLGGWSKESNTISVGVVDCDLQVISCDDVATQIVTFENPQSGCPSSLTAFCGHKTHEEFHLIPNIGMPELPEVKVSSWMPSFSLPSVSLPSVSLPSVSLPSVSLPSVSLPSVSLPSISTPSFVSNTWNSMSSYFSNEIIEPEIVLCPEDDQICQYIKDNLREDSEWVQYFDKNGDGIVTREEIEETVKKVIAEKSEELIDWAQENPVATAGIGLGAVMALYIVAKASYGALRYACSGSVDVAKVAVAPVSFAYDKVKGKEEGKSPLMIANEGKDEDSKPTVKLDS